MFLCCSHVHDDSDPQCSGSAPSQAEVARRTRGHVPLGLSSRRAPPVGRETHSRRIARALGEASRNQPHPVTGGGGPRRARLQVIVVDASALVEALLQTPAAAVVRERLFGTEQTLHAPHLIDLEVTQVLRRYAAIG